MNITHIRVATTIGKSLKHYRVHNSGFIAHLLLFHLVTSIIPKRKMTETKNEHKT